MTRRLYDISPPLTQDIAVFPGDTPLSREVLSNMIDGKPLTLSTMRATVHLGAHADAPSHYGVNAPTIDRQPLDLYIGPCQVVTANVMPGELIRSACFKQRITEQRLLIRTDTFPDPRQWNDDFAAIHPDYVDELEAHGVRLVGIDTPSVDPAGAKTLEAHHRFLKHNIAIIEGIVLNDVPDGVYELIALPLKLVGFDASPVRAVLREV